MNIDFNSLFCEDAFGSVLNDFLDEKHSEYWFKGGRGSTKSSFISLLIVLGLLMDENANAIIYRRVGNTVKDSVYSQMIWALDMMGVSAQCKFRKSPFEIIYEPSPTRSQRILFRGVDDPMKSKSIRLTRGYFKYLWCEELAEWRGMEDVRTIKQSVFRGVKYAVTFYSYNPPRSAQSWVNDEATKERSDRLVHHSTYLQVIEHHRDWLQDAFIADAEAIRQTNERAYRNEYLGEVTGTGGQVFDNLELREITDEEIQTFDRFYNGLDFGFAVDPDAFVRVAYVPNTRRIYVIGEYYSTHTATETLAKRIEALAGRELITCDSADPRMIAELRGKGLNVVGAKKGSGSRDHGYRWLQNLGAIVVDPKRTPNAARELKQYEYVRDKNGNFCAAYPDGNDHELDALRYATESLAASRIAKTGGFW